MNNKSGVLAKRLNRQRIATGLGLLAALPSGYVVDNIAGDKLSERDKILAKAGLAGSLVAAGKYIAANEAVKEEFKASKNALRLLKDTGLRNRGNVKSLKSALKTYKANRIIAPLTAFTSTAGLVGGYNWYKNRDKDKQ